MEFIVGLEAINLDGTVYDTDDLSTIRGASTVALEIVEHVEAALSALLRGANVTTTFTGSSRGEWRVAGCGSADMLKEAIKAFLRGEGFQEDVRNRELVDALPFMKFSYALVPDTLAHEMQRQLAEARYTVFDLDIPKPVDEARLEAAIEQDFSQSSRKAQETLGPPPPAETGVCSIDGVRPFARLSWRTVEQLAICNQPVSASVLARKTFGRTGRRPHFYKTILKDMSDEEKAALDAISFADSFEELVEGSASIKGLPTVIGNKFMAVYMDGNGFSKLRKRFLQSGDGTPESRAKAFSERIGAHRRHLLRGILEHFKDKENAPRLQLAAPKKQVLGGEYQENGRAMKRPTPVLRFETLMWGGDESFMVMPAWAFHGFMVRLSELLDPSLPINQIKIGSDIEPLTYGVGVVLASYKTPIRAIHNLSMDLCSNAKSDRDRSMVDFLSIGGVDVPTRGLPDERRALYKIPQDRQASLFRLPLKHMPEILSRFTEMKGLPGDGETGVPRAALHKLIIDPVTLGAPSAKMDDGSGPTIGDRTGFNDSSLETALKSILETNYRAFDEGGTTKKFGEDFLSGDAFAWAESAPAFAPVLHFLTLWNYLGVGVPGGTARSDSDAVEVAIA